MSKTDKLRRAKEKKNDEYYTYYEDVQRIGERYKDKIKDKIIYLNCDNPEQSNFYKFFKDNFNKFHIKKIISTFLNGYKTTYNGVDEVKEPLLGDGSFNNSECIDILKEVDMVITNPPFSILRDFLNTLYENKKDFIIVAPITCFSYNDIQKRLSNNNIFINNLKIKSFYTPTGEDVPVKCYILSSMYKKNPPLLTWKKIEYMELKKADNEDVLVIDKINDIPTNYDGFIAVPFSIFLYNIEHIFECEFIYSKKIKVDGKCLYARVLIRKKTK